MAVLVKSHKNLTVRSFEAVKDMASCLAYSDGYSQVLTDQGMNTSYVNSLQWVSTPGIYGILIELEEEVVGGILLRVPNGKENFPFEEVVGEMDSKIQRENCGELFAIWNSKKVAGWGLSYILLKAGFALGLKLKLNKLYYLVAEYNLRLANKLGLEVEKDSGNSGSFVFYQTGSSAKAFLCSFSFKGEAEESNAEKLAIHALSQQGQRTSMETALHRELKIDYFI